MSALSVQGILRAILVKNEAPNLGAFKASPDFNFIVWMVHFLRMAIAWLNLLFFKVFSRIILRLKMVRNLQVWITFVKDFRRCLLNSQRGLPHDLWIIFANLAYFIGVPDPAVFLWISFQLWTILHEVFRGLQCEIVCRSRGRQIWINLHHCRYPLATVFKSRWNIQLRSMLENSALLIACWRLANI